MKNLRYPAICVCILLLSVCANAQTENKPPLNEPDYNKPRMFDHLPEKITVNINAINGLFNKAIGASVDIGLAANNQFQFGGEVVSKAASTQDNLESVVIRSSSFNGAGLTITKIIEEDGTVTYRGRIVNLKSGDLFELQKIGNDYVLVKRNFYDLINE